MDPNIQAELRCIGSLIEILLEELPSFISYKPIYLDIKNYFLSIGWPVQLEVSPQKNVVCTISIKPPKYSPFTQTTLRERTEPNQFRDSEVAPLDPAATRWTRSLCC